MKNKIVLFVSSFLLLWTIAPVAQAQMMGTWDWKTEVTEAEKTMVKDKEAEGKVLYEQLKANTITCESLTDHQLVLIGEYFMGLIHGDQHPYVNKYIATIYGGETIPQMHLDLGKIKTGCGEAVLRTRPVIEAMTPTTASAPLPGPLMHWNGNSDQPLVSTYWTQDLMIRYMVHFFGWVLVTVGVLVVFWLIIKRPGRSSTNEILNQRYAKGEITKAALEKMKKELKK